MSNSAVRTVISVCTAAVICLSIVSMLRGHRATAFSTITQVTAENIADIPVRLEINHKVVDSTVRFTVEVGTNSVGKEGRLELYDGERLLASCAAAPSLIGGNIVFSFQVNASCLEKSKFTYTIYTSAGDEGPPVGACDSYWFYLGEFADK